MSTVTRESELSVTEEGWVPEVERVRAADFGGVIHPVYAVIHYTGSGSAKGTVDWLSRLDEVYVSAHFVVGRDGFVSQLVPVSRKAYHAGKSEWRGVSGLNSCSFGIELVNWGPLSLDAAADALVSASGKTVPRGEGVLLKHRHESMWRFWHAFTEEQVGATLALLRAVHQAFPVKEVLGHDDVSPGRKVDPGPAFPMERVRREFAEMVSA